MRCFLACESDARGRAGLESQPYPSVNTCFAPADAAAAAALTEEERRELKGPFLGERIREKRLAAVTTVKETACPGGAARRSCAWAASGPDTQRRRILSTETGPRCQARRRIKMPGRLRKQVLGRLARGGLLGCVVSLAGWPALATESLPPSVRACSTITDSEERLACYDREVEESAGGCKAAVKAAAPVVGSQAAAAGQAPAAQGAGSQGAAGQAAANRAAAVSAAWPTRRPASAPTPAPNTRLDDADGRRCRRCLHISAHIVTLDRQPESNWSCISTMGRCGCRSPVGLGRPEPARGRWGQNRPALRRLLAQRSARQLHEGSAQELISGQRPSACAATARRSSQACVV